MFASDDGAFMDNKTIVEVTRNPPDEECNTKASVCRNFAFWKLTGAV